MSTAEQQLAQLIAGTAWRVCDTQIDSAEALAEQIVADLKEFSQSYKDGFSWLIRSGDVYRIKETDHAGNDEDGDGPFTIWMVSTHDDETDDE